MVSDKGDIPDREDVDPGHRSKTTLLSDLLGRGETIVRTTDGTEYELHGYDTYIFRPSGTVYTQDEDDDEVWFDIDEIVSFRQH